MRINLKKLIQDRNLDKSTLAKVLFPANKHPSMALSRLMTNNMQLNEQQIYRLSIFAELSIDALFLDSHNWKHEVQNDLVRFTRDRYSAVYSPYTGITKIYHLDSLIATHTISQPTQSLASYLDDISKVVINNSIKS